MPARGWRLRARDDTRAVFGAWSQEWDGWVIVTVAPDEDGEWRYQNSNYGVLPGPTGAGRGWGLRLVWARSEFVAPPGERPDHEILLVNDRDGRWIEDRGGYWAIATVFDLASREPISPSERVAIAGVGRSYHIGPGEAVAVPVALAIHDVRDLVPGVYGLVARVGELGLESDIARLRTTAN